jgi:hypothetical protein
MSNEAPKLNKIYETDDKGTTRKVYLLAGGDYLYVTHPTGPKTRTGRSCGAASHLQCGASHHVWRKLLRTEAQTRCH